MHLPPKFHHATFTRSEVIVLTNKQTDASENIQRSSLGYNVGQKSCFQYSTRSIDKQQPG